MIYQYQHGGPGAQELRETIENFDLKTFMDELPLMIAQGIAGFIMVRCMTLVTFTDFLMVAIFDSADDELEAKQKGVANEGTQDLLQDWHKLYPPKGKKKEKKKDKKDKYGESAYSTDYWDEGGDGEW